MTRVSDTSRHITAEHRRPCNSPIGLDAPRAKNAASGSVRPRFWISATSSPRSSIRRWELNMALPSPNVGEPTAMLIDRLAARSESCRMAGKTDSETASLAISR